MYAILSYYVQIVGEYYLPIRFQLMALPGVKLADVKKARSHIMGLGQCRKFLREHGIDSVTSSDTAGAAREVAESGDRTLARITSYNVCYTKLLRLVARPVLSGESGQVRAEVAGTRGPLSRPRERTP